MPPAVVTLTLPEEPLPTVAITIVDELTLNVCAAVPPNETAVVPVKFVPLMMTTVPLAPLVGEKDVIVGGGIKVKPVIIAVPPGVVTLILPEAPVPTVAVIVVAFTTVNVVAATPPNMTAVAPVKFVPVIVITVPLDPLVGVNELIVGKGGI